MTSDLNPHWVWEPVNPLVAGMAGDIAKLFKNEPVKNPGVFAADPPSDLATLLAREVIQNSADSARERQLADDDAPEFEIDFVFDTFSGAQKQDLVSALDLGSLATRINSIKGTDGANPRAQLGLSHTDCLASLATDEPVNTLQILERGTTGMYGPFVGAKSKMYLALISIGYTAKASGSGGSYGYGKAGLIRGSQTRTVVAYTCFGEREDDPGVTRRLLGMTYWGQHESSDTSFTGFARFGHEIDGAVIPYENEDADEIATRLGIDVRDPTDPEAVGTTFLLIDPTVGSIDLKRAIERNWWPAIEDNALTASIYDSPRSRPSVPRPRTDPALKPFIEAYDLALSKPDNLGPEMKRSEFSRITSPSGDQYRLGTLGLVAELGGWSYAADGADEDGLEHRSLVALMRGPRMVVEYLESGVTRPFVRGTFVADDDVDDLLRQTEPKAHDSWQTRVDEGGVDEFAPEVASAIIDRTKRSVNDFRKSLKPPPRPAEEVRLGELQRLVGKLLNNQGRDIPPPPPGDRQFSIKVNQKLVKDDLPLHLRLEGDITIALQDREELPESAESEILISFRVLEDGGVGEEIPLTLSLPKGFAVVEDAERSVFRGVVTRSSAKIRFVSAPYLSDWTGRLKAEAQIIAGAPAGADS